METGPAAAAAGAYDDGGEEASEGELHAQGWGRPGAALPSRTETEVWPERGAEEEVDACCDPATVALDFQMGGERMRRGLGIYTRLSRRWSEAGDPPAEAPRAVAGEERVGGVNSFD